jgi:hypothetical protein
MSRNGKYKFDNSFRVSYPNEMYLNVRKWASKKGISLQEFQRKAVEFYLDHLNGDDFTPTGIRSNFKHLDEDFRL